MPSLLYLDTSAFLKLVVEEPESRPLRASIAGAELWSSTLLEVEAYRAARRLGVGSHLVQRAVEGLSLVLPSASTYAAARALGPDELRTLDAIHVATALELGEELEAVVTYDRRMAEGCEAADLATLAPS